MSREPSITFANVICHFGDAYVLLDLAEQVVIPAFLDQSMRRKFGETEYLFLNTGWFSSSPSNGGTQELCLYGQIVKDTVLHRDQILKDGQLVEDHESISSAPSSFFVMMLSNHKLVFLPETSAAPSLETFGSTMQYFLRRKHADFLNAEYNRRKETLTPITRLALLEEIPAPTVEVMPLASRESIGEFVASIEKLTHLEFRALETNREMQMDGPYELVRRDGQALGAKISKLTYDNVDGMNKAEVANQIVIAAAAGNQAVKVAGVAEDGAKMRGNNREFSMQIPAGDVPAEPRQKAFALLEKFRVSAENGHVRLDAGEDTRARIQTLTQNLSGGGDGQPR